MELLTMGDQNARYCLLQPVDSHDEALLPDQMRCLREALPGVPILLAAFRVENWNGDLSPWPAPAVFGKEPFAGEAGRTLDAVLRSLLPAVRAKLTAPREARFILGGYSLAGLFALWACGQTDAFAGCAAASPSVWFPGWIAYAETHLPLSRTVYLSLGDREEKARNPIMAAVGRCIRRQDALLAQAGRYRHTLVWNPGNHFQNPEERTARAFAWCVFQEEAARAAE